MMQHQEALDEDGEPVASAPDRVTQGPGSGGGAGGGRGAGSGGGSGDGRGGRGAGSGGGSGDGRGAGSIPERTVEYAREVRGELQKVAWPGRSEVVNYTLVVLVAVVLLTLFVFAVDYGSLKAIIDLFQK